MRGVWNDDALAEHAVTVSAQTTTKYHLWVALLLKPLPVHGTPFSVPRYLHLDLGKHMLINVARFRSRARTLRVETSLWQEHTSESDKCDQGGLQDEKHAVFLCSSDPVCSLRKKFAHLLKRKEEFTPATRPHALRKAAPAG
eukprot:122922-Pelagomonas_calceolata.AAC.1